MSKDTCKKVGVAGIRAVALGIFIMLICGLLLTSFHSEHHIKSTPHLVQQPSQSRTSGLLIFGPVLSLTWILGDTYQMPRLLVGTRNWVLFPLNRAAAIH